MFMASALEQATRQCTSPAISAHAARKMWPCSYRPTPTLWLRSTQPFARRASERPSLGARVARQLRRRARDPRVGERTGDPGAPTISTQSSLARKRTRSMLAVDDFGPRRRDSAPRTPCVPGATGAATMRSPSRVGRRRPHGPRAGGRRRSPSALVRAPARPARSRLTQPCRVVPSAQRAGHAPPVALAPRCACSSSARRIVDGDLHRRAAPPGALRRCTSLPAARRSAAARRRPRRAAALGAATSSSVSASHGSTSPRSSTPPRRTSASTRLARTSACSVSFSRRRRQVHEATASRRRRAACAPGSRRRRRAPRTRAAPRTVHRRRLLEPARRRLIAAARRRAA